MSVILSYVTHTLVDGMSFWEPSSAVGRNVLDSLAYDLLAGVLAESATPTTTVDILEAGAVTCDGFGDSTSIDITSAQAVACASGPVPLFITDVTLSYTNHSINWISPNPPGDSVAGIPATLTESIYNYLRAESAVILADIGIWNNNSILVSPAIFNATITPNSALSTVLSQNASLFPWKVPSVSAASQLRREPSIFVAPVETRNPATIAVSYSCRELRKKSVFRLVISVIVADASMFATFWGVFRAVTSYFASREDTYVQKSLEEQPLANKDDSDGE